MSRDDDRNALNRNEKGKRAPLKFALCRPPPVRVHKFIPKPLILVEKIKERQHALKLSPAVTSKLSVVPESVNRSMTAPLTHVTPTPQRMLTSGFLASGSHSSSSVSFRMSSQEGALFRSGFGMMPRSVRPLSVVTLGNSSSSTDTFVADSPCCIKQASKGPLPVMEIDPNNVHTNVEPDPEKKDTRVSQLVDSVAGDFTHTTCPSIDMFKPVMTSTPFGLTHANTNDVPSPTAFITSTARPTHLSPRISDRCEIISPTSRAVYPFNAPKGIYNVKLPNAASTSSLSDEARLESIAITYAGLAKSRAPLMTLANEPGSKPSLFKRPSSRVASPSPTLVVDGVFALPGAPPPPPSSSSPLKMLNHFPQPHKPLPRRTLPPPPPSPSDTITRAPKMNAPASTPHSPPSPLIRGQTSPESPRSKLAHVLTAHIRPQMTTTTTTMSVSMSVSVSTTRVHRQGKGNGVPPLVRGIRASNDLRTQCEIDGLRMRRVVGFQVRRGGVSASGDENGGGDGNGTSERMSLAGVGIVAKLRARWERGEAR